MIQIALFVVAIVLTIILLRKNVNIGLIMIINCVFIILSVGMHISNIGNNLFKGVASLGTLNLIVILTEVLIVENIMRKTLMIEKMVISLRGLIGDGKISAMALPAIIGLMPSPGGARFSCPMVDEIIHEDMKNEDKAFVNYWFRHIWRDGFILYPAVIIGSELLGVSVLRLFSHIFIFTILHVVVGYFVIGKKIIVKNHEVVGNKKELLKTFIINFMPIAIIIVLYMLLLAVFGSYLESKGITTMILLNIAVIPIIIYLLILRKYDRKKIKSVLKEAFQPKFILIIAGVMIFKEFLTDSGLIGVWIGYIKDYGIPKELLYIILPFIAGFTSGLGVNYASLALPILIPLGIGSNIWLATAAMMAGFTGVMVTPLHLCNIMSCDYFKTNFNKIISKVVIAESFMMLAVIIVILIFK